MDELRSLLDSGFELAKQGRYEEALAEFQLVLNDHPSSERGLYGAAACEHRLGNRIRTEELLGKLLRISPQHPAGIKLRNEIQLGGETTESGHVRDPLVREEDKPDPFGTGAKSRAHEIEVIPEWRTPDMRTPSVIDRIREGRIEKAGKLRIFAAYRSAWRIYRAHFRNLVSAGWISIFLLCVYSLIVSSIAASLVMGLGSLFAFLVSPTVRFFLLIAFLFGFPLLSVHAYYCYRVSLEGSVPIKEQNRFFEKHPYIMLATIWVAAPTIGFHALVILLNLLSLLDELVWIVPPLYLVSIFLQIFLVVRCWFLSEAAFEAEAHPVILVSRCFSVTRGNAFRATLFIILQALLFPLAILPLAIGYPFLCLAQVEAYRLMRQEAAKPEASA